MIELRWVLITPCSWCCVEYDILTTLYASFMYSLFNASSLSLSGVERLDGRDSLRRLASGIVFWHSWTALRNSVVRGVTAMVTSKKCRAAERGWNVEAWGPETGVVF